MNEIFAQLKGIFPQYNDNMLYILVAFYNNLKKHPEYKGTDEEVKTLFGKLFCGFAEFYLQNEEPDATPEAIKAKWEAMSFDEQSQYVAPRLNATLLCAVYARMFEQGFEIETLLTENSLGRHWCLDNANLMAMISGPGHAQKHAMNYVIRLYLGQFDNTTEIRVLLSDSPDIDETQWCRLFAMGIDEAIIQCSTNGTYDPKIALGIMTPKPNTDIPTEEVAITDAQNAQEGDENQSEGVAPPEDQTQSESNTEPSGDVNPAEAEPKVYGRGESPIIKHVDEYPYAKVEDLTALRTQSVKVETDETTKEVSDQWVKDNMQSKEEMESQQQ